METQAFARTDSLFKTALAEGLFTGGALGILRKGKVVHRLYLGATSLEAEGSPVGPASRFDLASLTKVLATSLLALKAVEAGDLDLEAPLGRYLPEARAKDVTLRDIMRHASGLPAIPALERFFPDPQKVDPRVARTHLLDICQEGPAGKSVVYSCTGFLLLGLALEGVYASSLATAYEKEIAQPLGLGATGYWPVPKATALATEFCPWRKERIQGEVHDESAWCLGSGGAGNAGLFSNLDGVLALASSFMPEGPQLLGARALGLMTSLQTPGLNEARALGFLLHGPETQDGPLWPAGAFGHTGFTGTSLFIEPSRGLGVVALTNRVYPGRALTQERMPPFRKTLHGAALLDFDEAYPRA